ncbi:MAG: MBL fold metallo-hydrolase [Lachnospiraceae bacterium]|nr:MBL fold metallo-hydrolase [Lachnospiraceae bacterium]
MSDIKVGRIVLSICATNCYYIYREGSTECIVIDPADRGDQIYEVLRSKGLNVGNILLTHGHFDHIWGCDELRKLSGAGVYALDKEEMLLGDPSLNASAEVGRPCTVKADVLVSDLEVMELGDFRIQVLATPGHTSGSCCYLLLDEDILFSGDTLFEESVGRTDLPTGNGGELARSIREKLDPLDDKVKVYPGHGDMTTIGHEREYNYFWN